MLRPRFLWPASLAVFSLLVASQIFSQQDVIDQRRKIMKGNSAASKALKKAVAANDYATIEAKAKEIAADAEKLVTLFPKGSTAENSRAKPEIWEKWDEFQTKLTAFKNAATELASTAQTKDEMQVGAKFKALSSSCGSCHKPFRAPRKRK